MIPKAIITGTLEGLFTSGSKKWHEVNTAYSPMPVKVHDYTINNQQFYCLQRHGTNRLAPHAINYRALIDALHQLGVHQIVGVNAVGAIDKDYAVGALVLPEQLIDYTHGRTSSFYASSCATHQHLECTRPYNEPLRQQLVAASKKSGVSLRSGGVVGCTQGPRLETAAEVKRLRSDGCNMVGMTQVPEVMLAAERSMDYAAVAVVVNPAAGVGGEDGMAMASISSTMQKTQPDLQKLLLEWISNAG